MKKRFRTAVVKLHVEMYVYVKHVYAVSILNINSAYSGLFLAQPKYILLLSRNLY